MRAYVTVAVLLCVLGLAAAACPNSCSGHGNCGTWDKCSCFKRKDGTVDSEGFVVPAFLGPDCSLRSCPYQLAWADVPYANDVAHKFAECSNQGTCDRKSGNCVCYPGYEGRACDRTVCPNSCSGHGTCQAMTTFYRDHVDALVAQGTAGRTVSYTQGVQTWDANKIFGCKCENGYRGPDCSMRECPTGTDGQGGPSGTPYQWPAVDGSATQYEYRDCSGRGVCDYNTGVCTCYKGQYGEDCSLQSALV